MGSRTRELPYYTHSPGALWHSYTTNDGRCCIRDRALLIWDRYGTFRTWKDVAADHFHFCMHSLAMETIVLDG